MSSLGQSLVPARLGSSFRWLLASSWTTNLGDGIAAAAGPLLVASLTSDPFLISLAALMAWAPPLVCGLWAGVLSDRHDRRLILILANAFRAVVLLAMIGALAAGRLPVEAALLGLGLISTAEVFADNTSGTLTPMLVHRDDLALANARLQTGFITLNQLAGPSLGAALFTAGRVWPFLSELLLVGAGLLLIGRVKLPPHGRTGKPDVRREVVEGVRWVLHHPPVRTLCLTILIFNLAFGAAWSVLVLYASDRLGLGAFGFGLITTVSAVGGLVGTASYGWLTARISLGNLMRIGLIIETLTHLFLAATRSPFVALPVFFLFGAHAFIWGTTSTTVRQRAVPTHLQGRVGSVNAICVYGGLVVGSAIGGLLAKHYGVAAPFWAAFGASAVFLAVLWPQMTRIAHQDQL
ncbi:MFS transporter [Actinoplanes sp. NEAU-A12]|uniref:MFS transporter n=1 Tax=Actinoplanes sandaracinus TaxID=3045177 RepID=A0ABT6WEJ6_9ACTN|nr:MFS transporter [Actinoplanes sandaracinus]MDI6098149.1 MFS transporter [Actinoplanes sandaracinus]